MSIMPKPSKETGLPTLKERAVAMTVYLLPDDHRRLKMMAASEDDTLQGLMLDAIDMLLVTRGDGPVVRWQPKKLQSRPR
jgi:hypothetical protein